MAKTYKTNPNKTEAIKACNRFVLFCRLCRFHKTSKSTFSNRETIRTSAFSFPSSLMSIPNNSSLGQEMICSLRVSAKSSTGLLLFDFATATTGIILLILPHSMKVWISAFTHFE